MISIRAHKRDMDFTMYDYVFEDVKKFEAILPFLLHKLEGEWKVILVEPKLTHVRTYLDTTVVPEHIDLVITMDQNQLEQLYLERPTLVKEEKKPWDVYMDMLKSFAPILDNKSMYEIYRRCGPREDRLRDALDILSSYPTVTMREVNKHFAPVTRVFANQVMRAFLLGRYKQAWKMLSMLEEEIGSSVAFYAMRKNIRHVFNEKCKYLRNEDSEEKLVEIVDIFTIIRMLWLFESAIQPAQLYPLLLMFERRQTPC